MSLRCSSSEAAPLPGLIGVLVKHTAPQMAGPVVERRIPCSEQEVARGQESALLPPHGSRTADRLRLSWLLAPRVHDRSTILAGQ